MRPTWGTVSALGAAIAILGAAPVAGAAELGDPAGPLVRVSAGPDLACQAQHSGDEAASFTRCGTFVAIGGQVYGAGFAGVSGSQAAEGEDALATTADLGASGVQVVQRDSYVPGQDAWRTDVTLRNTTGASTTAVVYRAGDCHLQGAGSGYGFAGSPSASVGCSAQPGNSPLDRVVQWVPLSDGATWMQGPASDVFAHVASGAPFANVCQTCFEESDTAAGISWNVSLSPGASETRSHWTVISPVGRTGPPPPVSAPVPPATTTVQGTQIRLTGPPRCVKPPARYRIRVTSIRKKRISKDRFGWVRRVRIHRVEFLVDGKRRSIDRRAAFKALLSSEGAAPGKHALTARVVLQPLRSKGRQRLVGKKFTRTLRSAVHVCS